MKMPAMIYWRFSLYWGIAVVVYAALRLADVAF